jgi:O-antigen ligase
MSVMDTIPATRPRRMVMPVASLQNGVLWLMFFSGCVVFIEPAPYEVAFLLAAFVFSITGLRFSVLLLPMILSLIIYNIGGGLSLMEVANDTPAIFFVAISVYMAIMAIVIAGIFSENAKERLQVMQDGYTAAAVVASLCGLMGYFNILGTYDLFTRYGRAMGPFKDPNVFGTFAVLPAVLLTTGFLTGSHRRPLIAGGALAIIMAGIFLSFSRGAWAVALGGIGLSAVLIFLTAQKPGLRARIILLAMAGIALFALVLVIALQFESVRATFELRASLNQSYDQGETGRFGNQRRSIPMLLSEPNGFGPLQFGRIFPEDPHNVYLNAFASYGWTGGFAYAALIACTLIVGWQLVFRRTPWQESAIAIWASFFFLIIQGFQIDTDHWRHWYIQLGLTWGLMVATIRWEADRRALRQAQARPA